jgi:hypothetical protein
MKSVHIILFLISFLLSQTAFSDEGSSANVASALDLRVAAAGEAVTGTNTARSQSMSAAVAGQIDVTLPVEEIHPGAPWVVPDIGAGLGFETEFLAMRCPGCDGVPAVDLVASGEARVHVPWSTVYYREVYQRPVRFSDPFWRDETQTIRRTVGVSTQGLIPLVAEDFDANILPFDWERRDLLETELDRYFSPARRLGTENRWHVTMGRGTILSESDVAMKFSMMDFVFGQYVVPGPRQARNVGLIPLYRSPSDGALEAWEWNLSVLDLRFSRPQVGLTRVQIGASNKKAAVLAGRDDKLAFDGQFQYALAVGQSLSRDYVPGWETFGDRMPRLNRLAWNLQVQNAHRIDPTGLAIDAGHEMSVDVATRPIESLTLSGRAAVIGLERKVISPLASPDAPLPLQVGDKMIMGRLEGHMDWEIHATVSLQADLWVERSDRADARVRRVGRTQVLPLDTQWGGWIGFRFSPF